MIDQFQFAPPQSSEAPQSPSPVESVALSRAQIDAAACEVAHQLGAAAAEAISCLPAKLADAKAWLPVSGPDAAPIWLVIVRGSVAVPRPGGGVQRARRTEVAVDAANGRAIGFRLPG